MKKCIKCQVLFENENFLCPDCGFLPEIVNGFESFAPDFITDEAGFRPEAFDKLYSLEAQNFWFRSRNKLILWALDTFFPDAETMLEIGCGTGYVLEGIAKSRPKISLCGSEIFAEGLQFAARRIKGHGRLFQMDARQIPFEKEFDIIGAFDVLEHIKQKTSKKPGTGKFCLTPPPRTQLCLPLSFIKPPMTAFPANNEYQGQAFMKTRDRHLLLDSPPCNQIHFPCSLGQPVLTTLPANKGIKEPPSWPASPAF